MSPIDFEWAILARMGVLVADPFPLHPAIEEAIIVCMQKPLRNWTIV